MDFNLNPDYVVSNADRADQKTPDGRFVASPFRDNRGVTDYVIRNAIGARYKDGLKDRTIQRVVARVQNALVRAVKDDKDTIELTEEQVRFILDTLKEWAVPPGVVAWHGDLLDSVEAQLRQVEDARAAAKNGTPERARA